MENYLSEYLPILIFIFIGFAIAIGMTTLSFVVGESKLQNIESYDAIADNSTIESEADNILDFSELNPFGEDEF